MYKIQYDTSGGEGENKMSDKKEIENIIENYVQSEQLIVKQLYIKASHGTTIGEFREEIWKDMFEQIIPRKFVIEQSVFIIDSKKQVSKEVDLAIFDEMYTPYIFKYGRIKFLPIEAVAIVIECKSTSMKSDALKQWVKSISKLQTANKSYTRMASGVINGAENERESSQTATRPLRILCCLNELIKSEDLDFDVVIRASDKENKLKIMYSDKYSDLKAWYHTLNHVKHQERKELKMCDGNCLEGVKLEQYRVQDINLLTFNLQLNQLLMLINNPILFPHLAYAEMFDEIAAKGEKKDE